MEFLNVVSKTLDSISFVVVLPELPVIAITFGIIFFSYMLLQAQDRL